MLKYKFPPTLEKLMYISPQFAASTFFEAESNSDINILVNGEVTKVSPNNLQTA